MAIPNASFWRHYIQAVFIPQVGMLREAFEDKILPAFDDIEREAEQESQRLWEELTSQPGDPDELADLSDLAEEAREAGIDYYVHMRDLRQAVTNLFTVHIRHLWEQQLGFLVGQESGQNRVLSPQDARRQLQEWGIDIATLQAWSKLEELRLAANTVKHADGSSCEKLKLLRPDLFESPDADFPTRVVPASATEPLYGRDLYVSAADIHRYCDAVTLFWNELCDRS